MAQAIPFVLMGASTLVSAKSSLDAGEAADKQAKREAAQIEEQGEEAFAQSTRESYEEARQGKILMEDARAAQAAGGGVTTDAGAIRQLGEIQRDTSYNTLAALFEGKTKYMDSLRQAAARREEGKLAKKAAKMQAFSSLLSGGSQLFSSFGGGSPGGGKIGNTRHPSTRR